MSEERNKLISHTKHLSSQVKNHSKIAFPHFIWSLHNVSITLSDSVIWPCSILMVLPINNP